MPGSSVRRQASCAVRSAAYQGLKYTRYRSLTALSKGVTPGPENSISKAVGASYGQELAAFAIELMEMGGMIRDPKISPYEAGFQEGWIMSPAMRVAGGTDEIQHNILGENMLGLPKEPAPDRGKPFREVLRGPNP